MKRSIALWITVIIFSIYETIKILKEEKEKKKYNTRVYGIVTKKYTECVNYNFETYIDVTYKYNSIYIHPNIKYHQMIL